MRLVHMLELLVCCACEKVIFAVDKTVSLISLLEEYTVSIPEGVPPPPTGAVSPVNWAVFAFWRRTNADRAERFEQQFSLVAPDGEQLLTGIMPFECSVGVQKMRTMHPIFGFPIAREGLMDLVISGRSDGQREWEERARYPLTVKYAAAESLPTTEANAS